MTSILSDRFGNFLLEESENLSFFSQNFFDKGTTQFFLEYDWLISEQNKSYN